MTDYIEHFGIKGQKWGVRRFQNEDRTLTPAGKERYNKSDSDGKKQAKEEKRAEKQKAKEEAELLKQARKEAREAAKPESSTWKSKEAKYLSDEELNRRNSRLQREKQYRDMTESRGHKFIKSFGKAMNKILIGSLIGAATGIMAANYKDILKVGESFITNASLMPIDAVDMILTK